MNAAVVVAIISGVISLIVGIIGPFITINLNRATAVKLLSEAAEKTGLENQRLNARVTNQRTVIVSLITAIDKTIPLLTTDAAHKEELQKLVDKARIDLYN